MTKRNINARKARGFARRILACMTSIVLVVGLMPGIALADDPGQKVVVPDGGDANKTIEGDIAVKAENHNDAALSVNGDAVNASANVTGSVA